MTVAEWIFLIVGVTTIVLGIYSIIRLLVLIKK